MYEWKKWLQLNDVLEIDVINRLCTTKEARRLRKWEECSLVLFTLLQFTTETSSFSECYRLSSPPLCRFHISWNFPIAHFRLSLSNRFILVFSSLFSRAQAMRISVSVRLKSPARMHGGDSLSGPTATRLLRMHRGRDDVMRLQRRKCNGTNIPSSLLPLIATTLHLHAPYVARSSSSDRSTLQH